MGNKTKQPKTMDDDDRNFLLMVVDSSSSSSSLSPSSSLSSSKSPSLSTLLINNNNNTSATTTSTTTKIPTVSLIDNQKSSSPASSYSASSANFISSQRRRNSTDCNIIQQQQQQLMAKKWPKFIHQTSLDNNDNDNQKHYYRNNLGYNFKNQIITDGTVTIEDFFDDNDDNSKSFNNNNNNDDDGLGDKINPKKSDTMDSIIIIPKKNKPQPSTPLQPPTSSMMIVEGQHYRYYDQSKPSTSTTFNINYDNTSNDSIRNSVSQILSTAFITHHASTTTEVTIPTPVIPATGGVSTEFPSIYNKNFHIHHQPHSLILDGQLQKTLQHNTSTTQQPQLKRNRILMNLDGSFTNEISPMDDIDNNNNNNIMNNIDSNINKNKKNKSLTTSLALTDLQTKQQQQQPYHRAENENNNNNIVESIVIQSNTANTNTNTTNQPMERGQWSGKLDFIFSCISYAVGLGNVWRFPYLCYENGGGAFLVPYLICIFVIGVPLFLMEVSLGQYFHAGGVSIWNQIPIFKGVGFASMIMIGLCNTYYIVIIAWTLYYLFNSLKVPLPWMSCDNWWNTASCFIGEDAELIPDGSQSPAQEFWTRNTLNMTSDMADVGHVQWHLFGTLIVAWVLVYLVIYKGIHQSGKIIWVMAIFPYVVLTILFGYGITLPGAMNGIKFYITPRWHMLAEAKIWVAAGTQLLFTYGIGIGTNIALGSYNPTNHNFYRDSFIACLLSSFTSLFSGFVIFSVLGHMAFTLKTEVEKVARSGPGLAFIVYPEAVTRLPLPNLWAILFFIMLLVLGIDSQFCTVESFVTGIVDEWPHLLRPHRKLFTLFVISIHFLLGISMITSGGVYVFQLMDSFSASGISLIIVVLFELLAFGWIYGGKRIYRNMVEMLNFDPGKILHVLWMFTAPICLLAILIFSIVDYQPPEYAGKPFPWYGELIGWCIGSSSIIFIPIYVLYYLFWKSDQRLTLKQRFLIGLKPLEEEDRLPTTTTTTDLNNNDGQLTNLNHFNMITIKDSNDNIITTANTNGIAKIIE